MTRQEARNLVMTQANHFLGKPYLWGGNDPIAGFDCSGLIVELLKSVGILPRAGDWGAAALHDRFIAHKVAVPVAGCLCFYGSKGKIGHVEMAVNDVLSIGASGGGSATDSVADAIAQDAYIKIRPMARPQALIAVVDPFLLLA